ncbi:hypothetical protein Rhal01_00754 [Rubritalea halochordaticola]|uniref:Endonuclease/exonuclease/phosphatase domain-containing protein n=1 Tax=Rubritalea halochordaticola TaxID=714537 RepID=A0ABP9UW51_9BACT
MHSFPKPPRAIQLSGVFCLCLTLLLLTGCDKRPATETWKPRSTSGQVEYELASAPIDAPRPLDHPVTGKLPVRFVSYNLRNYLTMVRHDDDKKSMRSKPEKEITALVSVLTKAQPDVLGVCEIGTQADLDNLQDRLEANGLKLPHSHLCSGSDPYRRQAILSRYPITVSPKPNINFQMDGRNFQMFRGILDVSIQLPGGPVRFLGVHLKSKRKVPEYDEELMRRHEAYLLAQHLAKLGDHPALLLYGDFNDTKRSTSIRSITKHLKPLNLKDKDLSTWTHYWEYQDVYSRFDYIFVSKRLEKRINHAKSHIISSPEVRKASDHRPLYVEIN